jgi:MFS transporter, ACS family, glucarate transporter
MHTSDTAVATNARSKTAMFAWALALIMYVDRAALSQAAPFIRQDLGLSAIQMGLVFSVFGYAYALFEIPGGLLGDRFGARKVLMRIVLWWSAFTAATGMVWNFGSLLATQALFGAGEAGCFPNLTRVLTTWLPKKERERAQARLWLATRLGAALTPILVMILLRYLGLNWRVAFVLFGLLGLVWAFAWYQWYRDDPSTHPGVNAAELALLPPPRETAAAAHVPLSRLFSNPHILLLCLQYACLAYGWWFYVTWLPTMVRESRGVSFPQLHPIVQALLTGLPLILGGVGCLVSGAVLPKLAARFGSVTIARRIMAITGFVGASLSIVAFIQVHEPISAMFVLGMAGFFNDFVMPAAWASTMDKGGRFAGTVSGAMNMVGGIVGASGSLIVGYILAATGNDWSVALYVSAAVYLVGAFAWLFLDPHTPVEA